MSEVSYEEGEEFLMEIPLPPNLAKDFEENPIVIANYVGLWDSEKVFCEIRDGNLKTILLAVDNEKHHIVSFHGQNWVNDLVVYDPEKLTFKAVNT